MQTSLPLYNSVFMFPSSALCEHRKKCDILQRQFHEEMEEVRSLREENLQLRQEVTTARPDLQSRREENSRLRQEVSRLQDQVTNPPNAANQMKESQVFGFDSVAFMIMRR